MDKYRFSFTQRMALWEAYGKICLYCDNPINYPDLQIDHILPEKLLDESDEFESAQQEFGLENEFSINSFRNCIPVHHHCNRRKRDRIFSKSRMIYLLEVAESYAAKVEKRYYQLERFNNVNKVLTEIRVLLNRGIITKEELDDFTGYVVRTADISEGNPVIISFGLLIDSVLNDLEFPAHVSKEYHALCDWLEANIIEELSKQLKCRMEYTEASYRNGESLSVRLALWGLDLNRLGELQLRWWEILEVALHTDIYEDFAKQE